jgi:hypothetical protein
MYTYWHSRLILELLVFFKSSLRPKFRSHEALFRNLKKLLANTVLTFYFFSFASFLLDFLRWI